MRIVLFCVGVLLILSNSLIAAAPPPVNDDCTNAIPIIPNNSYPVWTDVIYDVSGATTNGDLLFECPGVPTIPPVYSVWYEFTPETTATYEISTGPGTATYTNLDSVIGVYLATNGCGDLDAFENVDCSTGYVDFDGVDERAKLYTELTGGTTYLIWLAVGSVGTDLGDTNTIQLKIDRATPPENDTCADALVIPSDVTFPYVTPWDINLAGANLELDPISVPDCQTRAIRSVWFRFHPQYSSHYLFSTCPSVITNALPSLGELPGTVPDTIMAIYEAENGCVGTMTLRECDDDDDDYLTEDCQRESTFEVDLFSDRDYFIVLWQYSGGRDQLHPDDALVKMLIDDLTPPPPPIVVSIGFDEVEGQYLLEFDGGVGLRYMVEHSSDLNTWEDVGQANPTQVPGHYQSYIDPGFYTPPHFFRVRRL